MPRTRGATRKAHFEHQPSTFEHQPSTIWAPAGHNLSTSWAQFEHQPSTIQAPAEHNLSTGRAQFEHQLSTIWASAEHNLSTSRAQFEHQPSTIWAPAEHNLSTSRAEHNLSTSRAQVEHQPSTSRAPAEHNLSICGIYWLERRGKLCTSLPVMSGLAGWCLPGLWPVRSTTDGGLEEGVAMVKNPRSSKATTCMQHGGRVSKTTSAESKDCCVCVCVFVLFSDSFFWLEKGGVPAPRTYKVQAGLFRIRWDKAVFILASLQVGQWRYCILGVSRLHRKAKSNYKVLHSITYSQQFQTDLVLYRISFAWTPCCMDLSGSVVVPIF